jgi:hypothetical protein
LTRREQPRQIDTSVQVGESARHLRDAEMQKKRKRKRKKQRGTYEYSKEVLKKKPLRILSVNRASPADGSASPPADEIFENAVQTNFA